MARRTPLLHVARRPRAVYVSLVAALAALAVAAAASSKVAEFAGSAGLGIFTGSDCQETTFTATGEADTWIAEHTTSNKGSDAVLNVDASVSSGNSRALVRFRLPSGVPEGCVVETALLRLFSSEGSEGSKVEVLRLAGTWSENQVVWSNQPPTAGAAAGAWSRQGYMQWRVAAQVQAILEAGNHGFLIRDAAEGADGGGHGFHSREKGESPPELVVRFAAPPSGEDPGPPAPPAPARVSCGQVLTQSTLVTNDLSECLSDGLVIGADRIIVDLDGHRIDGVGLGTGIRNDGYDVVTIRNGTVQEFDYGVELLSETELNVVERLALQQNELAGVELFDADSGNEIRSNTVEKNGAGIALVSGTTGALVVDNTLTLNSGASLLVRDSNANRLALNRVSGGGDLGVGLDRSSDNTLLGNDVSGNSDGGIEIRHGSNGNRVEGNTVTQSGDTGIMVDESDGNELVSNTTRLMSDSGITLNSANDGIVRLNDVRFSPGGLQMDGSSRNVVEGNDASDSSGIGIELGGGSYDNLVDRNTANDNGSSGIYVADEALIEPGNRITRNIASRNHADGIAVAKGGHVITANVARDNHGWGINAVGENVDGRGNAASGNGLPQQCLGVVCKEEWEPPDTEIVEGPDDPTSATSASFTFVGSDDASPTAALRFECRLDGGAETGFAACSSPRRYTSLSAGSHTFEVRAVDGAGNVDPTPTGYTWTIDTTPPETTIESGPDDPTRSTGATFRFSADATSSTFECSLDGAPFAACTSPAEYDGLAPGAHRFEVRAIDQAGNIDATPANHTWTIDVTPPETTIDSGPHDPTTSGSASFSFSAYEPGSTFECSLDEAPFAACASPADYDDLAAGPHRFEVRATDRAGNLEPQPSRYDWTVDATPPETTIESGPAHPANSSSASFEFSSDEPGSTFQCSLDDAPFAACSSPADYDDLAPGTHRFQVQAIDPAGNTDTTPAAHAWTVDTTAPDTTPPDTTITSRPPDPTNSSSASFEFSSDEPGSTFECSLEEAPFAACTSPSEYTGLTAGTHQFRVQAIDGARNVDPTPAAYTWTIDQTAPETTIGSGPDSQTASTSAAFAFSADEPDSAFQCSLDGATYAACTSPVQLTGLAEGGHRFLVRASDPAGNTDPTPGSWAWTISAGCPTVTLSAGADSTIEHSRPSLNLGSDPSLMVRSFYARRNARSLVHFPLPAVPERCVLLTATLRLFAVSAVSGRTLQALRVTGSWTEDGVTWSSQPATTGPAATTAAGIGWRQWNVLFQVRALYAGGNRGFLIRDASEGSGASREQSFRSREAAAAERPQLVLSFG